MVVDGVYAFAVYPRVAHLMGAVDGEGYALLAETLLKCGSFAFGCDQHGTVFRGPGYPGFLAFVNLLSDNVSYFWTVFVQICLHGVAAVLLYNITRRSRSPQAANIAVALFLLLPVLHAFLPRYHVENLLMTLLLAVVAVCTMRVENKSAVRMTATGTLLGIAILVKQTMLLLPLLIVWVLLRNGMRWRTVWPVALLPYLIVLPWTVRNAYLTDAIVPVHVNAGMNLVIGNAQVEHFFDSPFESGRLWEAGEREVQRIVGEEAVLSARDEVMRDNELMEHGLKWMLHPVRLSLKIVMNVIFLFTLGTTQLNSAFIGIPFLFMLPFVYLGVRRRRCDWDIADTLMLAIVAYYIVVHAPIYAIGRFSIPILPLLLPFAAAGLRWGRVGG